MTHQSPNTPALTQVRTVAEQQSALLHCLCILRPWSLNREHGLIALACLVTHGTDHWSDVR